MKNILDKAQTITNESKKNIRKPLNHSYKLQMQLTNLTVHLAKANYRTSIAKAEHLLGHNYPSTISHLQHADSVFQAKNILSHVVWVLTNNACHTYQSMTDLEQQSLKRVSSESRRDA